MKEKYVHGYTEKEQERLHKQASILSEMTYENLDFSGIHTLLELGCGTGGQTEIILQKAPHIQQITAVDISSVQLQKAKQNLAHLDHKINFIQASATNTKLPSNSFDAIFICWLLEHVPNPQAVVNEAFRLLKPNGKIFITEVHNESLKTFPKKENVQKYMQIFNDFQYNLGGDPNIGIKLGTLTYKAGFKNIEKRSLHQLHDHSNKKAKEIIVNYFMNLYLSAADSLLSHNKISNTDIEGMKSEFTDLINDENGVYYYSPIQLTAVK